MVDVRSSPYSRLYPQFNREILAVSLRRFDIGYRFLGELLGGRSHAPSHFVKGRIDYEALARGAAFLAGIENLMKIGGESRVTIMCTEREPIECHRSLLVGRRLAEEGTDVRHIHADGSLESHCDAVARLVKLAGGLPDQVDLLRSKSEVEAEAYSRQAARVGYVDHRFMTSSKRA